MNNLINAQGVTNNIKTITLNVVECNNCKKEIVTRKHEGKVQCKGCGKRTDITKE